MGFFRNSEKEIEDIRGVKDEVLPQLTDNQIVMLALARLFEAEGVGDQQLIDEMYRRGRKTS